MQKFTLITIAVALTVANASSSASVKPRSFQCISDQCVPDFMLSEGQVQTSDRKLGLDACKVLCENSLWPLPNKNLDISFEAFGVSKLVFEGVRNLNLLKRMVKTFEKENPIKGKHGDTLKVVFQVAESRDGDLTLETDESYTLIRLEGASQIVISAKTVFGARHGLETLSQMLVFDEFAGQTILPNAFHIEDAPSFPYRGVMVDTARNFISVENLKQTIRALGMTKMNSLHLHLSDTASFPLQLSEYSVITENGAYSKDKVYSPKDIKELREYGLEHGVRVIPEIDQPGHAGMGWDAISKEYDDLIVCANEVQWTEVGVEPPTGQFNPTNPKVLEILGSIYDDLLSMFDSNIVHLGGDEIVVGSDTTSPACWNSSKFAPALVNYLEENGYDRADPNLFYDLWANFSKKSFALAEEKYAKNGKKLDRIMNWAGADTGSNLVMHLFENQMQETLYPKDKMLFQLWDSAADTYASTLIENGYDVILSNYDTAYLDCGTSTWVRNGPNWCPYVSWQTIYESVNRTANSWSVDKDLVHKHLLGSEANMWTEQVDDTTVVSTMWPRSAGLGEALWTFSDRSAYEADPRFSFHRHRMVQAGIAAKAYQPEWCLEAPNYSCTIR